jgi:hypothetical protein
LVSHPVRQTQIFGCDQKLNGFKYYDYILTYVDDCLVVSQNPPIIIDTQQNLKDIEPPLHYLGAEMGKYKFNDDKQAWYMSAQQYLQQAILEIESKWGALKKVFGNRKALDVPIQSGSHPELDTSRFLDDDDTQLYQSYTGVLRWA